ncbi:MAG TPA: DUF6599 family protein [Anaeromyxobacteraceae bacterium]|nr:DUF6599 family protein [Anaeromyxobacteraceae bacterium]
MRGRFRLGHAALLVVPALAVALTLSHGRRTREDERATLAALRALAGPALPSAEAASATRSSPPARYDRERLYELIDGAAETYLARGFEACLAATYAYPGPPEIEVSAEVHRFASEEGARATLEAERPQAAVPLPGLAGAQGDGSVLLLARGRDLLKLTLLSLHPRGREALLALAAAWAEGTR